MKNTFKRYAGLLILPLLYSNSYASDSHYIQQARNITHIEKRNEAYETYRLFEILDKDGAFKKIKELDPVKDSLKIKSIIDEFWKRKDLETRPDTPNKNEYKQSIMDRVTHCDKRYSTQVFGMVWDNRAEPVIKHGIPDIEGLEEEVPCWVGKGTCDQYYMEWVGKGIKLGFEGRSGYGFPGERNIPHKDLQKDGFEFATAKSSDIVNKYVNAVKKPEVDVFGDSIKAMKVSALSVLSFYNPLNKNYTTYINSGISGEKIRDNNDTTKFNLEILVYDEKGDFIVQNNNNLKILSKYLDKESWIPFYLPVSNLSKKSTISVSVSKEENNGKRKADILVMNYQLPSGSLSDIALSNYKIEQGSQITEKNGIKRNGYLIKENPSSTFPLEDTIYTYLEVSDIVPDSSKKYPYEISYYLVPLPKDKKKKGEITLSPLEVIGPVRLPEEDTLKAEVRSGQEDTTIHKIEKRVQEGGSIDNKILNTVPFYVENKIANNSYDYLTNALKIPYGIKSGPYNLIVAVSDGNKNVSKVAYREIHLKKGNKSS